MRSNLREDASFVEDEGWQHACAVYADFLQRVLDNPQAQYACLNVSEAYCPAELNEQSICINGDIGEILSCLV